MVKTIFLLPDTFVYTIEEDKNNVIVGRIKRVSEIKSDTFYTITQNGKAKKVALRKIIDIARVNKVTTRNREELLFPIDSNCQYRINKKQLTDFNYIENPNLTYFHGILYGTYLSSLKGNGEDSKKIVCFYPKENHSKFKNAIDALQIPENVIKYISDRSDISAIEIHDESINIWIIELFKNFNYINTNPSFLYGILDINSVYRKVGGKYLRHSLDYYSFEGIINLQSIATILGIKLNHHLSPNERYDVTENIYKFNSCDSWFISSVANNEEIPYNKEVINANNFYKISYDCDSVMTEDGKNLVLPMGIIL